jgi:branched-chain amino acid transport system ATP-binding protein
MTRPDDPVLEASKLSVVYGGVVAIDEVSISIRAGTIHGLIGPNGAGKTTTIDALSGFIDHRGSVHLDGEDISKLSSHRRAQRGLSRTWQSIEAFGDLTVFENCQVATAPFAAFDLLRDLRRRSARRDPVITDVLDRLHLGDVADVYPDDLPLGQRKLVGLARALASQPRVVLLDEPAAGLDSKETLEFGRRLRALTDDLDVAVALVDHDTRLLFEVSDEVTALDFGRIIAHGSPDAVRADQHVIDAYLGVDAS